MMTEKPSKRGTGCHASAVPKRYPSWMAGLPGTPAKGINVITTLTRRLAVAAAAGALLAGAGMAFASPASADQVWYQSIGRASATAECPASSADDQSAGWSSWGASWEQWNNSGKGGFVCSRSITWAKEATGVGCLQAQRDGGGFDAFWLNFGDGFFSPRDSDVFIDPQCSSAVGSSDYNVVYAADLGQATQLCAAVLPGTEAFIPDWGTANVFYCVVI